MKALRSVQWRMYLAALAGCLVTGGFAVLICFAFLQRQWRADEQRFYSEKAAAVAQQIDSLLSELNAVAIQLQSSAALQRMFVEAGSPEYERENYFVYHIDDRKEAQGIIWMFAAARPQIAGIHIFSGSSYVGMRDAPPSTVIRELAGREEFRVPADEVFKWLGPHQDEWDTLQQRQVISVVRRFDATDYSFAPVGTIEVQARYSLLEEICGVREGTERVYILAADGTVIYGGTALTAQQARTLADLPETDGQLHRLQGENIDAQAVKTAIGTTGWSVVLLDDVNTSRQSFLRAIPATFIAAIPVFLLILTVAALAVRRVVKPILQLTAEVEAISPNEPRPRFSPTDLRELDTLQQAFTRLLECTEEANQKVLLAQQTELNLRIGALQAQINPHYLFNSLSAISAVGTEENSERVPMMCYQLGELFRYVSQDENTPTTLADEMAHIERYITFMKWRYEDNLSSHILQSGPLEQISIARLSLQPLVENCFTHGFKGAFPPYTIRIDCGCSETGWHFCIADSGCGFSQEQIDHISREIFKVDDVLRTRRGYEQLKSQNMAILNLYIRLKLQYGQKLWFEILRDEELGGALVKIVVEYDRKEELPHDTGGDHR